MEAGKLNVTGNAIWNGGKTESGDENVHVGDMEGRMNVKGNKAQLQSDGEPYSCQANFRLVGEYLFVTDNSHCGGANVRFDGVYQRRRGARKTTK